MFSRIAPVVLFTAFSLSVAGAYVSEGRQPLTRPGVMSDAQMEALTTYYTEMKLALQVGDDARFEELINQQIQNMQSGATQSVQPDRLPAPYGELRDLLMDGSVASTKALLARHPDLDLNAPQGRYGAVPLIWATGHPEFMPAMVRLLLEHGADPSFEAASGYTLVHAATSPFTYYSQPQDMDALLDMLPPELAVQPDRRGLTPLHLALINSHTVQASGLLNHGADPNAPPPRNLSVEFQPGYPPLMIAGGNVSLVQVLLGAGADPTATNLQGRSILDVVTEDARQSELELQDRLSASAAEESDREYAADYARARDMIRAAVDGRLARGD